MEILKQKPAKPNPVIWLMILLAATLLACSLGSQDTQGVVRVQRVLPTFTPTSPAVAYQVQQPETAQEALPAVVDPPPAQPQPAAPAATAATTPTPPPAGGAFGALPTPTMTAAVVQDSPTFEAEEPVNAGPTPTDVAFAGPTPTPIPPATATPTPRPPRLPEPTEAPPPSVAGWSFVGVRSTIDETNAVVVGELINNTGIPQTDVFVSGTLYNNQGQTIEGDIDTASYVPVEVIPAGAHVPFELTVESSEPIYRLDLHAMSEPAGNPPRQDFLISNVNQWTGASDMYCLGGQVSNPDAPLDDYLIILATVYNDQGDVANFAEYSAVSPNTIGVDQSSPFEVCLDSLGQNIIYHEVRAIGR